MGSTTVITMNSTASSGASGYDYPKPSAAKTSSVKASKTSKMRVQIKSAKKASGRTKKKA